MNEGKEQNKRYCLILGILTGKLDENIVNDKE